jgi:hypothetical protein
MKLLLKMRSTLFLVFEAKYIYLAVQHMEGKQVVFTLGITVLLMHMHRCLSTRGLRELDFRNSENISR